MNKFEQNYGFLPIALIYIVASSMALGFFLTCFALLFKGIVTIHPYYMITGVIGSTGLLMTAIVSIKDWKKFKEEQICR